MRGLWEEGLCDEMFDGCGDLIKWDFERVWKNRGGYGKK